MKFFEDAVATKEGISQEVLLKHLKRIEGQVRGIEKMLVAGRDGESLVTRYKPDMGLVFNRLFDLCYTETRLR